MTIQEKAIEQLERVSRHLATIGEKEDYTEIAIQALEQECEDAVSRTNLLKQFEDRFIELQKAHRKDAQLGVNWCINTLKDMPAVTPVHKKGKWVYSGSYDVEGLLYCSNCTHKIDVSEGYFKYCPNCGAKMDKRTLKYADQDTMMQAT